MKFFVTSSPHIRSGEHTGRIMADVALALLPAAAAGVWLFGLRAAVVIVCSVGAAAASQWAFDLLLRRPGSVKDGSAVVTGLLLALILPASVPCWVAAVGSVFAIVVVKGLCGGLGHNPFNPALGARAFLMLAFPVHLVRFPQAGQRLGIFAGADMVTAATPLHHMQMPAIPEQPLMDMFLGRIGGCIGETSTLALLVGGGYLLARGVISWRIPVSFLATLAAVSLVFAKTEQPFLWMVYSLLGGGAVLGAFFMATDYASSPVTVRGQLLYGALCGALTVFFRYYGLYPEGVTYAILLMNAAVWLLEGLTPPPRFGTQKGGSTP